jgi:beta-barrel assembly-enhancing protease
MMLLKILVRVCNMKFFTLRSCPQIALFILTLVFPLSIFSNSSAIAQSEATMEATDTIEEENTYQTPFSQAKQELPEDIYVFYRITDRLARANRVDIPFWDVTISSNITDMAMSYDQYVMAFHDNLLDLMSGNLSAVAFVVAHEMAHHTENHILQINEFQDELLKDTISNGGINPFEIFTDPQLQSQMLETEKQMAEFMIPLQLEADRISCLYLVKAGFDPEGAIHALNVLKTLSSDRQLMDDRIKALQPLIAELKQQENSNLGEIRISQTSPLIYELSEYGDSIRLKAKLVDYPMMLEEMFGE